MIRLTRIALFSAVFSMFVGVMWSGEFLGAAVEPQMPRLASPRHSDRNVAAEASLEETQTHPMDTVASGV